MSNPGIVTNLVAARARLGECPVWDEVNNLLYWVDIYNHRVHSYNPVTKSDSFYDVGDAVGSLALTSDRYLLLALRHQIALLDPDSGAVTSLYQLPNEAADTRFNDGKCDPQGRFWVGTVSDRLGAASLYCFDTSGKLQLKETNLTISNGLGWSPDGKTFYLTDSRTKTIYAYNFDGESGEISDRRPFADLSDAKSEPDGLAVDVEGCLWSAQWDGWCIIRFDPDGKEMERIPVPVPRPTCCIFGGEDLQDLYLTSASVGLSQKEIQESLFSGDLFAYRAPVAGLPGYRFNLGDRP